MHDEAADATARAGSERVRLDLVTESFPGRPGFDTAITRALLLRASAGDVGHTLRLHRPDKIVAFGRRDAAEEGFTQAVRAAAGKGFSSVMRLAGGRAAVFTPGTIAFSRTIPDPDPPARTFARFVDMAGILAEALKRVGVPALVGEVPGEYCPGDYSVNDGKGHKLVGIGQRLVARAAHVGGVIVAEDAATITDVLVPVYDALGLEWQPATVGAVEDVAAAKHEDVAAAVKQAFAARFDVVPAMLDEETLDLAAQLEPDHRLEAA